MATNELQFIVFREELYKNLNNRADATMDLIDAICGNQTAASSVQFSFSPLFRRQYASLHDAADNFSISGNTQSEHTEQQQKLTHVTASLISQPVTHNFYLMAWRELMMRGWKNIPMHKHPFTVLCITTADAEGNMVYRKPYVADHFRGASQ